MTHPRLWGLIAALASLVADQALKQWLLYGYGLGGRPTHLGPFTDLVLTWNRGISYSLFTTNSEAGRAALLSVTLLATLALVYWLWKTQKVFVAVAVGLLVGGALGNAYDRYVHGAVMDFVWLHTEHWSWYIFNGADVAITAGVIMLLLDAVFVRPASKSP